MERLSNLIQMKRSVYFVQCTYLMETTGMVGYKYEKMLEIVPGSEPRDHPGRTVARAGRQKMQRIYPPHLPRQQDLSCLNWTIPQSDFHSPRISCLTWTFLKPTEVPRVHSYFPRKDRQISNYSSRPCDHIEM